MFKRLGIVCSGGDAPGINGIIHRLYQNALQMGVELIGYKDGFNGIYTNNYKIIEKCDIQNIELSGGSIIGCERFPEFAENAVRKEIVVNIRKNNVEHLIVLGGNGTLCAARLLSEDGIKVHFIPTTIDNDIDEVSYTLGFDTCLNTIVECIRKIKDSAYDHNRLCLVEVMGRACPNLADAAGCAVHADAIYTCKNYVNDKQIVDDCFCVLEKGMRSKVIVITEHLTNINKISEIIAQKYNIKTWSICLGHIQRGGAPNFQDCFFAAKCADLAIKNAELDRFNLIYDLNRTLRLGK